MLDIKGWYISSIEDRHDYWFVKAYKVNPPEDPRSVPIWRYTPRRPISTSYYEIEAEGKTKDMAIKNLVRLINKREYKLKEV